ncbi:MAG TPA: sialidase family protein [Solirubrobacteraceae bacterium]|jgi:hypothetical protein
MSFRMCLAGTCVTLLAGVFAGSAGAAGTPVRVPDNPLGGSSSCAQQVSQQTALGSTNYPDDEVEPYVAADPTNPMHLIASVQQDRWNDGGANGLTNTVSVDGGQTWSLASSQPAFTICEGATQGSAGFLNRGTDPWVSFSSDGKTAYSISDSFNADGPAFGGASSIIVSRSTDGGMNWDPPVTAEFDASNTVLNDKESVTADSLNPVKAYAAWDRLVSPSTHANPSAFNHSPAFRGPAMFSSTSDSGASWSKGRVIFDPGQNNQTIGNVIVQPKAGPAAGVVFDGFDLILNKGAFGKPRSTFSVAMVHSSDGGGTWSGPTIVAQQQVAQVFINGEYIRTSDELPEFATGPEGNMYAVWQDGRFESGGTPKIAFSMSTDGGSHWSSPIRIDQSPGSVQAFTPQITVRSDGTVAVQYYDLENATASQPGLTDQFLVSCSSACTNPASWAAGGERRLSTSGSFDMLTAPSAGGPFVGDYDGLVPAVQTTGSLFDSAFVMAKPIATNGPTDLFANGTP